MEHGRVLVDHRDVLLSAQTLRSGVGVEDDRRVVLAHVVIGLGLLVDVGLTLEARVGHVLLVGAPRDALVLEKIDQGRDVGVNLLEVVVVAAEGVTANGGDVVRHGRVSDTEVVVDADALRRQPLQVGVGKGLVVVGVLQPDGDEAVEDLSLIDEYGIVLQVAKHGRSYLSADVGGRLRSLGRSLSSSNIGTGGGRVDVGLRRGASNGERAESESVHVDRSRGKTMETLSVHSRKRRGRG